MSERMFDIRHGDPGPTDGRALRDELRTHTSEWLRDERRAVVREQQRLKARELAIVAVLDERGAAPVADASVSAKTARETVEVARALSGLPAIADRAHAGEISWDQLKPLVEIATASTDAAWARKAPGWAPADLQRRARAGRTVTAADAAARREARELRWWDEPDTGMVAGRFRLPDVDGIPVADATVDALVPRARAVEQDHDAPATDHGPGRVSIPAMLARELERRDPYCRYPGCERTRNLQHHHLEPVCHGGRTTRTNLVRLCAVHHRMMEPQGSERIVGDPDQPDGLTLVEAGADARAGPAP